MLATSRCKGNQAGHTTQQDYLRPSDRTRHVIACTAARSLSHSTHQVISLRIRPKYAAVKYRPESVLFGKAMHSDAQKELMQHF